MKKMCCIKDDENNTQTCCIGFENNNECEYENASSERLGAALISNEILKNLGFTFHDYYKTWQHQKPKRTSTIELNTDFSAIDFSHKDW